MDRDRFLREIDDNRRLIEEISGRAARHFCYPSGLYRPHYFPWLRERGVISAATCEPGLASRKTDPMRTPRLVDAGGLNDDEFEGWLCGVSAALPRARYPANSGWASAQRSAARRGQMARP